MLMYFNFETLGGCTEHNYTYLGLVDNSLNKIMKIETVPALKGLRQCK